MEKNLKNNISTNTKNDEDSDKRREEYGKCPTCNRYNTSNSWCQSCDPQLLTEGWTSGNETLDKLIKSTQLKAKEYYNVNYLEWIPYNDLTNIEWIGEGGFATVFKATWKNGVKYIVGRNERCAKDRVVAIKRLHKSQNISDEFLNEVIILLSLSNFF